MHFHEQINTSANLVTRINLPTFWVGSQHITQTTWVSHDTIQTWHISNVPLTLGGVSGMVDYKPSIILFGTDAHDPHCLLDSTIIAHLHQHNIGIECCNLQSACHTYNLLINEGRRTILATIF